MCVAVNLSTAGYSALLSTGGSCGSAVQAVLALHQVWPPATCLATGVAAMLLQLHWLHVARGRWR
ncbi:hypothetical protein COO60DRAFT_1544936 [Scenedesmus sp. NREL 46B-D3]|nr:hypothetical protein COO60DRAFT_1544936 [Scenedesmus sp. NREL 46B-D3]